MKKLLKKMIGFGMAAAMCVSLAACTPESPAQDPVENITLVLDWTPNTNHTGFYVALEKGYFEEEGLNVTIVQPPEDGATAMVASGQAQFGIDFQDYLVPVFEQGEMPVVVVAALLQHNTSGIISLKEDGIYLGRKYPGRGCGSSDSAQYIRYYFFERGRNRYPEGTGRKELCNLGSSRGKSHDAEHRGSGRRRFFQSESDSRIC